MKIERELVWKKRKEKKEWVNERVSMGNGREHTKGERASWERREPMKTSLKKRVGMHDGKESGKNMWSIKIKLKNKDWHTCERCMGCKNSFFFFKKTDTHVVLFFVESFNLWGPIEPCVQTVLREVRPNI